MSAETQIKPCPLCEQPAKFLKDFNWKGKHDVWIVTHECEGEIKFYVEMRDFFLSREEAVDTWNEWVEGMRT